MTERNTHRWKFLYECEHIDNTALIFVASLTSYDRAQFSNSDQSRIHESLKIFRQQIMFIDRFSPNMLIFLFLTKRDLFVDKIKRVPITVAFPQYKGKENVQECYQYIKKQFENQCIDENHQIYVRCVSLMDKNCVERVMNNVQRIIASGGKNVDVDSFAWQNARLIWIAFLKNNDNHQCLFNLLSKDVVKYILNFLPTNDSGWHF